MELTIRPASEADAQALLDIYTPYVTDTAITFEYEVPSLEEFCGRVRSTLQRWPYLAAARGGEILGYAYASAFHPRAAYGWAAETTVYIRTDCRGEGIGRRLYTKLEEILAAQGILNTNACIAYPNPGSIAFHQKLGYETAAHFHRCGYKLGQWYDMVWMEKMLGDHKNPPSPVLPFPAGRGRFWEE